MSKSKLEEGLLVTDSDNNIAFVKQIYERENVPNQILIQYLNNNLEEMVYECDLKIFEPETTEITANDIEAATKKQIKEYEEFQEELINKVIKYSQKYNKGGN